MLKNSRPIVLLIAVSLVTSAVKGQEGTNEKTAGPLRVHPTNSRYFADGTGSVIYLTGSHTWASLQDCGLDVGSVDTSDPPREFDFNAYLELLTENNHNFIRLWRWELPQAVIVLAKIIFRSLNRGCEPDRKTRTIANRSSTSHSLTRPISTGCERESSPPAIVAST